jgi:hypothetical protein
MLMIVRQGAVPDFSALRSGEAGSSYSYGDLEVKVKKEGAERYVMLPPNGQDHLVAGDYYIAAISEGQNPVDDVIGTGTSSGVLSSAGALAVTNLGTASVAGLTQPVSLAGGQTKAYQFTVPVGTASLEGRLDNRVGDP